MAKLRTRNHKVVLARSAGGDAGITVLLVILGVFMFLPMLYVIMQSLKPLDELWMYPPRFIVTSPTLRTPRPVHPMNISWVPFSRYIFNTVLVSVAGTFGHLLLASMAAYALAKDQVPGKNGMFQLVQLSLMFNATVTTITSLHPRCPSCTGWIPTGHSSFPHGVRRWVCTDEAVHGYQRQ